MTTLHALPSDRLRRADALFCQWLDLPQAERAARLGALAREDAALAALVRALLDADAHATASPDTGAGVATLAQPLPPLPAGTRFGAFVIERLIGRGGMGEVYLAERDDGQFRQRVAIKRIGTRALDDPEIIAASLAHERTLLARLEHPGIARLIDGGVDEAGHPWLAMEYVEGQPLDAWLATQQPSADARFTLVLQLVDAVSHAHRHWVAHGDLKPANVLVDIEARLRVLDFGIARPLGENSGIATRWVTPGWSAPEQRDGHGPDIASDQYQLGLLARLILAGNTPRNALHGDLARVIEHTLADNPTARYPDLSALRADLIAAREHRPISLRMHEPAYRAGRFARRNAWALALACLAFAGVLGGWLGTANQARIARAERDLARQEVRRQDALREHLMLILREGGQQGSGVSVRELLDASTAQLEASYGTDAVLRRDVLLGLGELYFNLGDLQAARALLERYLAHAGNAPVLDRALAAQQLAAVLLRQGDADAAHAPLQQAESLLERSASQPGRIHALTLGVRSHWLRQQGRIDEGLALQRRSVDLMTTAHDAGALERGVAQSNLGMAYVQGMRLEEAHTSLQHALDTWREAGLAHNTHALTTLGNLGMVALLEGRATQARDLLQQARERYEQGHPETAAYASVLSNLARAHLALDDTAAAQPLATRAQALMARLSGEESLDAASIELVQADIALARHQLDAAYAHAEAALARMRARTGPTHPLPLRAELTLARIAALHGDTAAASELDRIGDALDAAPPMLRRAAVHAYLWAADAWLAQQRSDAASTSAQRAAFLATTLPLPLQEQTEAAFWLALAQGRHDDAQTALDTFASLPDIGTARLAHLRERLAAR